MTDRVGVLLMHRGDPDSPATAQQWLAEAYGDPHAYRLSFSSGAQKFLGGLLSRWDKGQLQKRLETIGGRSAAAEQVTALAAELEQKLNGDAQGTANARFRVLPAMRWTAPSVKTAVEALKKEGVTRVVGISLYPQQCHRFSNTLVRALEAMGEGMNVSFIDRLTSQPKYHEALRTTVTDALERAKDAYVLFVAMPLDKADADEGDPYPQQLVETVEQCMSKIDRPHRLGWMEDGGPGLTAEFMVPKAKATGASALVLVPIGTVVDELQVLWQLEWNLKGAAKQAGFTQVERAQAVVKRSELTEALQAALDEHLARVLALGFKG